MFSNSREKRQHYLTSLLPSLNGSLEAGGHPKHWSGISLLEFQRLTSGSCAESWLKHEAWRDKKKLLFSPELYGNIIDA